MDLIQLWVPILLVLIAPASLAYPSNTRSQNLTLPNDASPGVISQVNLTSLGEGYPVYPTACSTLPSRRGRVPGLDGAKILSDCYGIINEVLLRQDDLLFEDLLFTYKAFIDNSGNWHSSQWFRGRCVINVACTEEDQEQKLQLFNVVLAANQILKECVEDQRILRGGTTSIGSPRYSFYVGVLGLEESGAANESNIFPLSTLDLSGQNVQSRLSRARSNTESSAGDYGTYDSTVSLPPKISVERRASDPQPGSSLSTGSPSFVPEGTLSIPSLISPSTNISGSVKTPPSYPVKCFNPYAVRIKNANVDDCKFVINHIILGYPHPMLVQSFGYSDSADIDLSLPQNFKWEFGTCAIFVKNVDKSQTDNFRMVDVAYTALRIVMECVDGAKYPVGGIADVGTVPYNFFVGLGGVREPDVASPSTGPYLSRVDLADDRTGADGAL